MFEPIGSPFRTLVAAAGLALLAAVAQAEAPRSITIPAGELDDALELLAEQTGIQLLYDHKRIEGLKTRGVAGAESPQAAVTALIKGTPLVMRTDASGAILISAPDSAASGEPSEPDTVVVTGIRFDERSASATGLQLSLRETPQSVTVLNRDRIEQFALTSFSELINQAVGVNVDRGETDRTVFNARGFDVTNFQVDGVGLPLISGIQYGDVDTYLFEQIEIVRGANGLVTGIGNPSATINYIRKRPQRAFGFHGTGYAGSYDRWRGEFDLNAPLDDDGRFRGRLIAAREQRDSHLDFYHLERNGLGLLLAADLTDDLTATVGYTYQKNETQGSSWGSPIHFYADGGRIDHPRSVNFAPPWAQWPVTDQQAFAELAWNVGEWKTKGIVTYSRFQESPTILYPYGFPDRGTGLGVAGYTADYESDYKRYYGDVVASGPFTLFGRRHQLTVGASHSRSDGRQWEGELEGGGYLPYPDLRTLSDPDAIPRPAYPPRILRLDVQEELDRFYVASQLNLADPLKVIAGGSYSRLRTSGVNYGQDAGRKDGQFSPYVGILYDLVPQVTLYASYTNIFNPQSEVDIDRRRLDPVKGKNLELGLKSELLDKKLYVTAVGFWTKQSNVAEYAGDNPDPFYSYYEGVDTRSRGWELEVAGKVTSNFEVSGGLTRLSIEDHHGDPARTYAPRTSLKLASTYRVPELRNLTAGLQLRYQGRTYGAVNVYDLDFNPVFDADGNPIIFEQKSYLVADLALSAELARNLKASLVVNNLTNRKYLYSLVYAEVGEALYAPDRNMIFSLSVDF